MHGSDADRGRVSMSARKLLLRLRRWIVNAPTREALQALDSQVRQLAERLESRYADHDCSLDRLARMIESPFRDEALPLACTPAVTNLPQWTINEWQALEKKGLFVIGSARSGTTILANCLNACRQVYLLEEPCLFVDYALPDFSARFNARHREYENTFAKGAFVPAAMPGDEDCAFALLRRLARDRTFVGEKVAIGPKPNTLPDDWQPRILHFYSRFFFPSAYILTVRRPGETAWSMSKMFPQAEARSLLECWLQTLDVMIDVYLAFERTHVSFFDRFSPDTVATLARLLNLDFVLAPGTVDRAYVASALKPRAIPDLLAPHSDVWQRCDDLYQLLLDNFSPETMRYDGATNGDRFFREVKHSIADLLAQLGYARPPHAIKVLRAA
jgi:hypothetical protein